MLFRSHPPFQLHSARARQALRPPGPWTNATVQRFRLPGRPKRRARSENEAPNGKSIAFPPRPPQQTTVHVSKISSRNTTVLHFCESDRGMPVPRPAPSAHPRCHTSFANSRALRAIPRACLQLPRLISKVNFANSRARCAPYPARASSCLLRCPVFLVRLIEL